MHDNMWAVWLCSPPEQISLLVFHICNFWYLSWSAKTNTNTNTKAWKYVCSVQSQIPGGSSLPPPHGDEPSNNHFPHFHIRADHTSIGHCLKFPNSQIQLSWLQILLTLSAFLKTWAQHLSSVYMIEYLWCIPNYSCFHNKNPDHIYLFVIICPFHYSLVRARKKPYKCEWLNLIFFNFFV